ncbi:MAG: UDP-N-acetylmuramoyl-L-alanyl-D-glutamate--2,6-diaminopimelate ligase, partial [Elusimicrobia bacterium]|nr:UDP-N-acetylmuramoyl-L-alanyl-D-glutamate--2,6-diaminopimelate ligase [Elusimicrobiota bacterium]
MNLNVLLEAIKVKEIFGNTNIDIKGLSYDSRKVSAGDIFFALNGTHTNGIEFADQAISKGAICIISSTKIDNCKCTNLVVDDVFSCMSKISAKFYDYPDKKLTIIGVTGTNGKTTTVTLLYRLFKSMGYSCGLLSTIANYVDDERLETTNTTVDPITLN